MKLPHEINKFPMETNGTSGNVDLTHIKSNTQTK